ncbi:MAG: YggS family pyridoxal phosphate-dependent enzyme [Oscillospiraceae bacterium]|jgi:pyridoxal phosphate enzyme (YggS family)|nr:YggS family pyridoxal phosphate-dependent enzyme [Oscillospiraceae bacterium]
MSIADNVKRIRDEIGQITSERVYLVAASKMNDAARVREAVAAGVDAVGENRVQELLQKNAEGAYTGAPLHFIGRLQSNKVKNVVGLCDLIESADSRELIARISARAEALGLRQNILLEVNIGKEAGKSGVPPEEADALLDFSASQKGVNVLGLMAVPPISVNLGGDFHLFDAMTNLFVDMRAKKYDNVSMQFLSMGMSGSFAEAIRAGANMVRIGSAIFGARQY